MRQFDDTDRGLYNVVLVTEAPCGGEKWRHSEVVNAQPQEWARAVQWVHGLMRMIGEGRPGLKNAVDAYLEPVTCRRPWTSEIQAAFGREQLRGNIADPVLDRERAKGELLHAALCQLIGSKRADAVRDGKSC